MSNGMLSRRQTMKAITTGVVGAGSIGKVQATEDDGQRTSKRGERMPVIHRDRLEAVGVSPGEQVRLLPQADVEIDSLVETVPRDIIGRDIWTCVSLCDKLEFPAETTFELSADVVHPEIASETEARERDEFFERLSEPTDGKPIAVTAPHGGHIEYNTAKQAQYAASELNAPEWSCLGFNKGGGAFDRWHITSTELSRESFPKLNELSKQDFAYAISFHGFLGTGIAVGGGASRQLKEEVCEAIDEATQGEYEVYVPRRDSTVAGTSPRNYVNWLADDNAGVQLEQSPAARRDDWKVIARAVSDVFAEK